MNETATRMLVFMISFWILLLLLSNIFGINLSRTDITNQDVKASEINIVNAGNTLLGIMTFQYAEDIPVLLSIFLDTMFIFTLVIFLIFIRG